MSWKNEKPDVTGISVNLWKNIFIYTLICNSSFSPSSTSCNTGNLLKMEMKTKNVQYKKDVANIPLKLSDNVHPRGEMSVIKKNRAASQNMKSWNPDACYAQVFRRTISVLIYK